VSRKFRTVCKLDTLTVQVVSKINQG